VQELTNRTADKQARDGLFREPVRQRETAHKVARPHLARRVDSDGDFHRRRPSARRRAAKASSAFAQSSGVSEEERIFIYSARNDGLRLDDQFVDLMGGTTKGAAQRASDLANQLELNEAYVCDHLSFESALIAHAVRARGGEVFLWPHSSNAAHPLMYEEGDVAAVRCTTNSSARVWSARLPGTPCVVQSDLILRPCAARVPQRPGAL
jgi:hypothetical protein